MNKILMLVDNQLDFVTSSKKDLFVQLNIINNL